MDMLRFLLKQSGLKDKRHFFLTIIFLTIFQLTAGAIFYQHFQGPLRHQNRIEEHNLSVNHIIIF